MPVVAQIDIKLSKEFKIEKSASVDVSGANRNILIAGHRHWSGLKRAIDFYWFDKNTLAFQGIFSPIPKNSEIEGKDYYATLSIKGKILLFYDVYNSKLDKYAMYAVPLGEDGKSSGDFIKLMELDAKKKSNKGIYQIITNADSSKICVIASPSYEKNTNEKLVAATFDNNLKNLTTCRVTLNYKDNKYLPGKFILANDGDLLMRAIIYVEKKGSEKNKSETYPALFKIKASDGTLDEYQLKIPGLNLHDVDITTQGSNKIICAGFYNDTVKGKRSEGVFYLRIDKDSKVIEKISYKALPDDIAEELKSETETNKDSGIIKDFEINHILSRPNGNTMLIGQKRSVYAQIVLNSQKFSSSYYYSFEGPLVINIDKNGEVTWVKILTMKQSFTIKDPSTLYPSSNLYDTSFYIPPAPPYGGYALAKNDDKVFLIYNDHKENRLKKVISYKDARTVIGSSMIPVVAQIDNMGNYTIEKLFDSKSEKPSYMLNTKYIIQLRDNVLLCALQSQTKAFRTCFNDCTCGIVPLNRKGRLAELTFK